MGCSASGQPPKLRETEILFVAIMGYIEYGGNLRKAQRAMYHYGNIKLVLDKFQLWVTGRVSNVAAILRPIFVN